MNLEEYNNLKYKNWVDFINLQNLEINCPKCNKKIQDLPGTETGNPKQIKVECSSCKYKGFRLV